jgi:hypothetical protein
MMNRTVEASFFPEAAEALKKPSILIIDINRDLTPTQPSSGWKRPAVTLSVKRTTRAKLIKRLRT